MTNDTLTTNTPSVFIAFDCIKYSAHYSVYTTRMKVSKEFTTQQA